MLVTDKNILEILDKSIEFLDKVKEYNDYKLSLAQCGDELTNVYLALKSKDFKELTGTNTDEINIGNACYRNWIDAAKDYEKSLDEDKFNKIGNIANELREYVTNFEKLRIHVGVYKISIFVAQIDEKRMKSIIDILEKETRSYITSNQITFDVMYKGISFDIYLGGKT